MRAGQLLLVLGSTSAFVVTLAAGCGGSSSVGPADSGSDVTTNDVQSQDVQSQGEAASVAETGPEAGPEASVDATAEADALPLICLFDADVLQLDVPDAAIGDGGQSVAGCLSCIQTSCGPEVTTCSDDCTCKVSVQDFVICVAQGKGIATCVSSLLSSTDPATTGLFGCVLQSTCPALCGAG